METEREKGCTCHEERSGGMVMRRLLDPCCPEHGYARREDEEPEGRPSEGALRYAAESALDSAEHWRSVSVRDRRERNEAHRELVQCRRDRNRLWNALSVIASMEGETMSEAGDAVDIAREALEAVEGDGVDWPEINFDALLGEEGDAEIGPPIILEERDLERIETAVDEKYGHDLGRAYASVIRRMVKDFAATPQDADAEDEQERPPSCPECDAPMRAVDDRDDWWACERGHARVATMRLGSAAREAAARRLRRGGGEREGGVCPYCESQEIYEESEYTCTDCKGEFIAPLRDAPSEEGVSGVMQTRPDALPPDDREGLVEAAREVVEALEPVLCNAGGYDKSNLRGLILQADATGGYSGAWTIDELKEIETEARFAWRALRDRIREAGDGS